IIETTMSGKYFERIIRYAKNEKYEVIVIYIFLENPKICIERVKNRLLKGGHYVPEIDIIRRFYRSLNLFYTKYRYLSDICYLINNTDDDFEQVAIFQNKKVNIINENVFNKFLEVVNERD
ncbi:hypothetical protein OWK30_10940, partial [Deferribacter abyssi]